MPEEVFDLAQKLLKDGVIVATPQQTRCRNRMASKVSVPACFAELVRFGFISPNYAWAPKGFIWRKRTGEWVLQSRGG